MARQLDAAVAAFHRRPLKDTYRLLVLDGVVLRRKTGAGALARPVLVALGLRLDGKVTTMSAPSEWAWANRLAWTTAWVISTGKVGEVLGDERVVYRDLLAAEPARVVPGQGSARAGAGEGERNTGKGGVGRVLVHEAQAVTRREAGWRCQSEDRHRTRRGEGHGAEVRAP